MNNPLVNTINCIAFLSMTWLTPVAAVPPWRQTDQFAAPEAKQAAAADEQFVFVVTNHQIAKYDRHSKQRVAVSTGEAKHLNSGFLWNGNLLCAHSNYPRTPERSEIKILDVESMRISTFKDFGASEGSLTWVVRQADHWWCNFAKYGELNSQTLLVEFDDQWQVRSRWSYPKVVIEQLGRYSLSGGIWYGNELLVSGHDKPELYRLRLPDSGKTLEYLGKLTVPFQGQGFAIDPLTGGMVGINRANRQVILVGKDDEN